MAYQLIYTSAPRLLQAGRSGFGTVARHEAIRPLLVSAIERFSQFERTQGLANDRIIYAHRHVTVQGTRYYVLSRILDAGADYTGRTNHLAHHFIFEQRDVAELFHRGLTPADVMLSLGDSWKRSWSDAPAYLNNSVPLDRLTLGTERSAPWWKSLTGRSERAAILISPQAIKNCYVLWPEREDFQQEWPLCIFGESLQFVHDRPWDITFTTCLQPSDDAAEFQWRGVFPDSPLHGQVVQSGRPNVFDLARPDSLPLPIVEPPLPPETGFVHRGLAVPDEDIHFERSPNINTAMQGPPASKSPPMKKEGHATKPARRKLPLLWSLIAGAAVVIIIATWGLWTLWINHLKAGVRAELTSSQFFYPKDEKYFIEHKWPRQLGAAREVVKDLSELANYKRKQDDELKASEAKIEDLLRSVEKYRKAENNLPPRAIELIDEVRTRLHKPIEVAGGAAAASSDLSRPVKPPGSNPTPSPAMDAAVPSQFPKVPTYFVVGNDSLAQLELPDSAISLELTQLGSSAALIRGQEPSNKDQFITGAGCVVEWKNGRLVKGIAAPQPPYSLIGRSDGVEKIRIRVLGENETDGPLFPPTISGGLTLEAAGQKITIANARWVEVLKTNIPQNKDLKLKIPDGYSGLSGSLTKLPFPNFSTDLRSVIEECRGKHKQKEKTLDDLREQISATEGRLRELEAKGNDERFDDLLNQGLNPVATPRQHQPLPKNGNGSDAFQALCGSVCSQ